MTTSTPNQQAAEDAQSSPPGGARWLSGGLAVFFGVGAAFTGWLTVTTSEFGSTTPRGLAGLLLGGVITFFFAVAALVAVYHSLRLDQQDHALGLPTGSVRAIIALILIFLFFLMAVFLYLDVSRTATTSVLDGLSQQQVDSIDAEEIETIIPREVIVSPPDEDPPITEARFDVVLRSARQTSQVAEDIARQLITTIGTLIVAIAAFYFGAGSVEAAKQAANEAPTQGNQPPTQTALASGGAAKTDPSASPPVGGASGTEAAP